MTVTWSSVADGIKVQAEEIGADGLFKKDGAIVGTTKLTVSADGIQLIATWRYGEIRGVRVYDRQ